jgi:hypothetical protein
MARRWPESDSLVGRLDASMCELARVSRDRAFDRKFFTGVLTTGVYCRPACWSAVGWRRRRCAASASDAVTGVAPPAAAASAANREQRGSFIEASRG